MKITDIEKLNILDTTRALIETKKIITPIIKNKLIELGFKEVSIGAKEEHEIKSKELKIGFAGYDIAIGLASRPVSYSSGRLYRAMVIKF